MRIFCCFHPKHYPRVYRNDHWRNIDVINCRHLECRHRERFELTRCKFAEMVMIVIEMLGITSQLNCFAVAICLLTSVSYIGGALVTYLLFYISHSILSQNKYYWSKCSCSVLISQCLLNKPHRFDLKFLLLFLLYFEKCTAR